MTPASAQGILFRAVTPVPMQKAFEDLLSQIAETLHIGTAFIQEQSHDTFNM